MRTDLGRTIWALICPRSYLGWINLGSASIRRWSAWILAAKQFKNCLDVWYRCSYDYDLIVLNVYYMRSIITVILSLTPVIQQWPFLIFNKKKLHSSLVIKRRTRFCTQVRILILNLSFMHNIFTLCFNQLQHLHFLCHQVMLWMLFSSFSCHISYLSSFS